MQTTQRVIGPNNITHPQIAVNYSSAINGLGSIANEQQNATNSMIRALSSARNSESAIYGQEANDAQNNGRTMINLLGSHIKQNNALGYQEAKQHNTAYDNLRTLLYTKHKEDYANDLHEKMRQENLQDYASKLELGNQAYINKQQDLLTFMKNNGIANGSGTNYFNTGGSGNSTINGGIKLPGNGKSNIRTDINLNRVKDSYELNLKNGISALTNLSRFTGINYIVSNPKTKKISYDKKALKQIEDDYTLLGIKLKGIDFVPKNIGLGGNTDTKEVPNATKINQLVDVEQAINTGSFKVKGDKVYLEGTNDGKGNMLAIPKKTIGDIFKNPNSFGSLGRKIYAGLIQSGINTNTSDNFINNELYDELQDHAVNRNIAYILGKNGTTYDPNTGYILNNAKGKPYDSLPDDKKIVARHRFIKALWFADKGADSARKDSGWWSWDYSTVFNNQLNRFGLGSYYTDDTY